MEGVFDLDQSQSAGAALQLRPYPLDDWPQRTLGMPLADILFLAGIIGTFALFIAVLAWLDWEATRHRRNQGGLSHDHRKAAADQRIDRGC